MAILHKSETITFNKTFKEFDVYIETNTLDVMNLQVRTLRKMINQKTITLVI